MGLDGSLRIPLQLAFRQDGAVYLLGSIGKAQSPRLSEQHRQWEVARETGRTVDLDGPINDLLGNRRDADLDFRDLRRGLPGPGSVDEPGRAQDK